MNSIRPREAAREIAQTLQLDAKGHWSRGRELPDPAPRKMIPEDHLEFLQAVWTRRATYTYVFFGLNIAVFLLMALAGGSNQ